MTAQGLYKSKDAATGQVSVWVNTDGLIMDLPPGLYERRGYLPLIDDLPWHDEYSAARRSA